MSDIVVELLAEARRARDEHGNTDFYHVLNTAAREVAYLREEVRGLGVIGDICTYEILREVCRNCRCRRRNSAQSVPFPVERPMK